MYVVLKNKEIIAYSNVKRLAKKYAFVRSLKYKKIDDDEYDTRNEPGLEIIEDYVHVTNKDGGGCDVLIPMTVTEFVNFQNMYDEMFDELYNIERILLDSNLKNKYTKSIKRLLTFINTESGKLDTASLFLELSATTFKF